jgi:hypothetical protein
MAFWIDSRPPSVAPLSQAAYMFNITCTPWACCSATQSRFFPIIRFHENEECPGVVRAAGPDLRKPGQRLVPARRVTSGSLMGEPSSWKNNA